jgi:L-ascorbate metabolism protein UlaG (beta-lactamase superfamily)
MSVELTWLGHNCWAIQAGKHHLLLDPFLDPSPTAPIKADAATADFILVSHGHFDHVADLVSIAKRTNAVVVAAFEICEWVGKHGVKQVEPMNLGGSITLPFGQMKMTNALHSSVLPDGTYGGNPAGFLLTLAGRRLYFACDTALFSDMSLIGAAGLDAAILPIGDRYTMGPEDSVEATKLLRPKRVLPAHYNTWPPIAQDAEAWAKLVRTQTSAEPVVLQPGEKLVV